MKKILAIALFFALVLSVPSLATGVTKNLTADEIVEKSNLAYYYAGDDGRATVNMVITDRRGRKRVREMVMLRKDIEDGGRQKFYVFFKKPSDVSRMVFMVWKQTKGDDDRWLYLPAIDLVKRIASTDKRSSFAGGVFTYEDVSGRRTSDDKHELIGEESVEGKTVYVIKNTPKDKEQVDFAYYIARIDKETFLPVRGEFYNDKGKHFRTIEITETGVVDGFPTVLKARAENLDTGLKTAIEFKDVKYNLGIKERIFGERYLRRPPKEVK